MYCFTQDKILNLQNWILTKIFLIDFDIDETNSNIKISNLNYITTEQPIKEIMSR